MQTLTPTAHCPTDEQATEAKNQTIQHLAFRDQVMGEIADWRAGDSTWITDQVLDNFIGRPVDQTFITDAEALAQAAGHTGYWYREVPAQAIFQALIIREAGR